MKLAHRLLFAVLFSFQRTIALSDLITLSRHFSFVKFFSFFFAFSCRLPPDRRRILSYHFIFLLSNHFSNFIGSFLSAHTSPFRRFRRHLSQGKTSHSLLQRLFAPRKVIRLLSNKRGRFAEWRFLFCDGQDDFFVCHFFIFCFSSYKNRLF